ncbi:MAG TPA: tetratricopeptide repeat protein, partial [Candidatus Krumholzibacteria bacterium]|nr:tetratricopeptide repeat protein [Candidatus Krumholzibacteria bacterium]
MLQRAVFTAGLALACAGAPPDDPAPLSRARSRLAAGDTASAIRALENAGAHHGEDADAARLLGQLYRDRGTIQGRLRSQSTLENACARHPGDIELDVELATTYFEQGFYPDAVRALRDILAREPDRCDARKLLGLYHYRNWMRMNEYADDLATARRELREALECDASDADVALQYVIAGYAQGDSIESECDRFIARFPDRPEFRLMRGTVAFESKRYDACAADYAAALERMDDATFAVYTNSLTHVLGAIDDERYQRSTEPARDDFQRRLWLVADPDPTTETNPRWLEHVYRLFVADCLYSNQPTGRRGWATDRGEAFVRFGRPMEIEYVMGDDWRSGKVETWSFVTEGIFHQLVFVDEFLNGNPRIPYEADLTLHFMRHSPA